MSTLGKRLKECRTEKGVSQAVVSKAVGLAQASISDLENELYPTSTYTLKLSAYYGVNPHWLESGKGSKNFNSLPATTFGSSLPGDSNGLMEPLNTIADRIRISRTEAGLSQYTLAKAAGLSPATIGDIERGRNKGSTEIVNIAKALNVSASWLATGNGIKESSTTIITVREPVLDDLDALLPEDADVWRAQIRAAYQGTTNSQSGHMKK